MSKQTNVVAAIEKHSRSQTKQPTAPNKEVAEEVQKLKAEITSEPPAQESSSPEDKARQEILEKRRQQANRNMRQRIKAQRLSPGHRLQIDGADVTLLSVAPPSPLGIMVEGFPTKAERFPKELRKWVFDPDQWVQLIYG